MPLVPNSETALDSGHIREGLIGLTIVPRSIAADDNASMLMRIIIIICIVQVSLSKLDAGSQCGRESRSSEFNPPGLRLRTLHLDQMPKVMDEEEERGGTEVTSRK